MARRQDFTRRAALMAGAAIGLPAFAQPPIRKGPGVYDENNPPAPAQQSPTAKQPGVYIDERDAFPNSVVGVNTAVTAFIGPASPRAKRITPFSSFEEYRDLHEPEAPPLFTLDAKDIVDTGMTSLMERSVRWFHMNGGREAYTASASRPEDALTLQAMLDALARAAEIEGVNLLVAPDAIRLSPEDCVTFQKAMLAQCVELGDRFAILDVHPDGGTVVSPLAAASIFRNAMGPAVYGADYGAAYLPTLRTGLVDASDISVFQFEAGPLAEMLLAEDTRAGQNIRTTRKVYDQLAAFDSQLARDGDPAALALATTLHKALRGISPTYANLISKALKLRNLMPGSPALAGLYSQTDDETGVWRAPTNRSLVGVIEPALPLNGLDSSWLAAAPDGPSINHVRSIQGVGPLVWGARTLDATGTGNGYISIRRTKIFLRSSIDAALRSYVFAPNEAGTWAAVRAMIASFLNDQWKRGGLQGSSPDDAYLIQCGLGVTMTAQDVADGRLIVNVGVALARPAEFDTMVFEVSVGAR